MGMYTQVRGWLCCSSGGSGDKNNEIVSKFKEIKESFSKREDLDRAWLVAGDTHITNGSNGSLWIFIGSEHKNYDGSMDEWIKTILNNIKCEGRIEYQYEDLEDFHTGEQGQDKVLIVLDGKINKEMYTPKTEGYGFK